MDEFSDLGSKLKQVREAKGISLEDVQAQTKIPIDILRSIERDEKIRKLSPIYLKGFLKIYAKFLGIKIATEQKGFAPALASPSQKQSSAFEKQPMNLSLRERIDYSLWIKIIVTLVILIALIYFGVKISRRKKSLPKKTPVSNVAEAKTPSVNKAEKTSRIKLSVRAKENAWLQVKRDGKTVFRQILRKGISESWIAKDKLELSIGNAAALELELNNKIIAPLGKRGQALKSVLITKDGLTVKE